MPMNLVLESRCRIAYLQLVLVQPELFMPGSPLVTHEPFVQLVLLPEVQPGLLHCELPPSPKVPTGSSPAMRAIADRSEMLTISLVDNSSPDSLSFRERSCSFDIGFFES